MSFRYPFRKIIKRNFYRSIFILLNCNNLSASILFEMLLWRLRSFCLFNEPNKTISYSQSYEIIWNILCYIYILHTKGIADLLIFVYFVYWLGIRKPFSWDLNSIEVQSSNKYNPLIWGWTPAYTDGHFIVRRVDFIGRGRHNVHLWNENHVRIVSHLLKWE